MDKKNSRRAVLPVLFAFFVMGFCDIVGISSDYAASAFGWSATMAGLIPSVVFVWFFLLGVPFGVMMNRLGRKNTVLLSMLITVVGMVLPLIHYDSTMTLVAYALLGIGNAILQVSVNPLLQNVVTDEKLLTSSLTAGQVVKATMVYRYTHDRLFLDFAQKVTDIYLKRLRETSDDMVPRWDMDDLRPNAPKDASAACVVASALLELSSYLDGWRGQQYRDAAVRMLADLSSERYQSRDKNVSFLLHSTGHHPAGSEIDASIVYADYYYIEALTRLKRY